MIVFLNCLLLSESVGGSCHCLSCLSILLTLTRLNYFCQYTQKAFPGFHQTVCFSRHCLSHFQHQAYPFFCLSVVWTSFSSYKVSASVPMPILQQISLKVEKSRCHRVCSGWYALQWWGVGGSFCALKLTWPREDAPLPCLHPCHSCHSGAGHLHHRITVTCCVAPAPDR